MPKVLDNIITAAAPDPASYTVALTWANGERTVSSFRHMVGKGVFAAFADPAFFAQVRVGERGRSLGRPGELDFCADALWFEAHPEDAPLAAVGEVVGWVPPTRSSSAFGPPSTGCTATGSNASCCSARGRAAGFQL